MRILYLTLLLLFLSAPVRAETIVLKSGQTVEGQITERTDKYIKVKTEFSDTGLTYFLDEVESIDGQKIADTAKQARPQEPAEPHPAGKPDTKDVFNKIRLAIKNEKSFRIKSISEMDMAGMSNTVTEIVTDTDLGNKKIMISQQIKDMKVSFERQINEALEEKIAQAQKEGVPLDKLEEMRQALQRVSGQTQQMMVEMAEKMKSIVTQVYLIDNLMYMNVSDKWVKMEEPFLKDIWTAYSLSAEKAGDRDSLKKELSDSSYLNDAINPFLDLQAEDLFEVTEAQCEGTGCYLVDVKDNKFFEKMKYVLMAAMKREGESGQQKINPERLFFDSLSLKQYVSLKDYLPLNSVTEVRMHYPLEQPKGALSSLQISILRKDSWSFPGQEIILPKEAQTAVLVNSEEEATRILFGDLMNMPQEAGR